MIIISLEMEGSQQIPGLLEGMKKDEQDSNLQICKNIF